MCGPRPSRCAKNEAERAVDIAAWSHPSACCSCLVLLNHWMRSDEHDIREYSHEPDIGSSIGLKPPEEFDGGGAPNLTRPRIEVDPCVRGFYRSIGPALRLSHPENGWGRGVVTFVWRDRFPLLRDRRKTARSAEPDTNLSPT